MAEVLSFLLRHGYGILFAFVLAEQIGLPLPAAPILLAMGALAASGNFSFALAVVVAAAAAVIGDSLWFELGKRRGESVLGLLCRISLEPDSCVKSTKDLFRNRGGYTLLFAKFVPGLSTAAPPLAGMLGWSFPRFLLMDLAGSLLWVGAFMGTGYLFHAQLEQVAASLARLGWWAAVLVGGLAALFVAWKYIQRKRFIRSIRIARITPGELMHKLESQEDLFVVDLRRSAGQSRVPRAVWIDPSEIELRHGEIPRDREVVLYCN